MTALQIILLLSGIILALTVVYIVIVANSSMDILKSSFVSLAITKSSMAYYLPTGSLQIKMTATVVIESSTDIATGNVTVVSADVASMAYETIQSIIPDTDFLIGLNYVPSVFMNDDIKLVVGPTGLLDNINTTTEDRIASIIGQITDAPSKVLSFQSPAVVAAAPVAPPAGTRLSTVAKTYSNTLIVTAQEVRTGFATYVWKINTDGNININSTVNIKLTSHNRPLILPSAAGIPDVSGIITRPLTTYTINISHKSAKITGAGDTEVQLPDLSRLINVPIKRSPFVKRLNTPKFSNGMLIEIDINKPSELEGAISIPITVVKALVSIPSALFNFNVQHKYQGQITDLTMLKKLQDLQKQVQSGTPATGQKQVVIP